MGTEKEGLTEAALRSAAESVRIPMAGRVNSLNAATAAAVVVYEAVRQRSRAVSGAPLDVCDDDPHAS